MGPVTSGRLPHGGIADHTKKGVRQWGWIFLPTDGIDSKSNATWKRNHKHAAVKMRCGDGLASTDLGGMVNQLGLLIKLASRRSTSTILNVSLS